MINCVLTYIQGYKRQLHLKIKYSLFPILIPEILQNLHENLIKSVNIKNNKQTLVLL